MDSVLNDLDFSTSDATEYDACDAFIGLAKYNVCNCRAIHPIDYRKCCWFPIWIMFRLLTGLSFFELWNIFSQYAKHIFPSMQKYLNIFSPVCKMYLPQYAKYIFPNIQYIFSPTFQFSCLLCCRELGTGHAKNRMNFRKGSNPPLTPNPRPSEWSLFLDIMCMHFILSGPHTYMHMQTYPLLKICIIIFWKWGWGWKAVWNFSENSSNLVAWSFPFICSIYETVANVPESCVWWRADFQSGSRVELWNRKVGKSLKIGKILLRGCSKCT